MKRISQSQIFLVKRFHNQLPIDNFDKLVVTKLSQDMRSGLLITSLLQHVDRHVGTRSLWLCPCTTEFNQVDGSEGVSSSRKEIN